MRWHIIRTLLHKEALRHLANRGGIALALLLVVAALLLGFFGERESQAGSLINGVQHCFIDYWEDDGWVAHLRGTVPETLQAHVRFRDVSRLVPLGSTLYYPPGAGAIQLRPLGRGENGPRWKIWCWRPGEEGSGMAPFEAWFWRETQRYFQIQTVVALDRLGSETRTAVPLPQFDTEWSALQGGLDPRSAIASALVLFALFFVCVYLLPSLTCEERERGILLAQALSPASALEILAAKFLFYPVLGIALAALLAGICQPSVLARPFFWCALAASGAGSLGIGLTIASIARTQRAASMGALCYMMSVAMLLVICQQAHIPGPQYLTLEYYGPRMIHAALSGQVYWFHWLNLAGTVGLACAWGTAAVVLFRKRGWQ